ncbi:MAG: hypothetical protein QOJ15_4094 [Bradyrhizobium sp.]|jgi:hypothetical protein|nr:hypothetical protein [Bradyrhizobium sp.]
MRRHGNPRSASSFAFSAERLEFNALRCTSPVISWAGADTDLPDRLFGENGVQPLSQKYFCFRLTQIKSISPPSRLTEGRFAIVTDARRDAVDADALQTSGV